MCISCWRELGEPKIVTELTKAASRMIGKVYEYSISGGNCHIVIDDFNLENKHIDFCLEQVKNNENKYTQKQLVIEKQLLDTLRTMSLEERASALALYEGFYE